MELSDAFVFESEIQIISGKNKNTRVFIPRISLFHFSLNINKKNNH